MKDGVKWQTLDRTNTSAGHQLSSNSCAVLSVSEEGSHCEKTEGEF